MQRYEIIKIIGENFHTENIENGEYRYVVEAGSKAKLEQCLERTVKHFMLDIRI